MKNSSYISSRGWLLTCALAALTAGALVATPEPAVAQFGGVNIGGFRLMIGPGYGYRSRGRRNRAPRGEESSRNDDDGPPRKEDSVTVSKNAPSSAEQTKILALRVASSTVTGAVGSTKDLTEVGRTSSKETDRDYTRKIEDIIKRFNDEQKRARDNTPGDVTAHAIEQSLEKAFKSSKLETFERFVGESWTAERWHDDFGTRDLELAPLFQGNDRGNAPMEALDTLIQRAGESVYRRIFQRFPSFWRQTKARRCSCSGSIRRMAPWWMTGCGKPLTA